MKSKLFLFLFLQICFISDILSSPINEYIIGVEESIKFPFQYIQDGEYMGNYRKIFDEFAKSHNIKFKYKPLTIDDLYNEFFDNTVDFKFPDNKIWRSSKKEPYHIFYSQPITHYLEGLFVNIENIDKKFQSLKKVGIIDDVFLKILDNKSKENTVQENSFKKGNLGIIKGNSCAELLVMLNRGDIDAIFCNYDVMNNLLKSSNLENKVVLNTNYPLIDNYLQMSSMTHPEIIQKLDNWIVEKRSFIEKLTHEN